MGCSNVIRKEKNNSIADQLAHYCSLRMSWHVKKAHHYQLVERMGGSVIHQSQEIILAGHDAVI